jgi:hypothetical protein
VSVNHSQFKYRRAHENVSTKYPHLYVVKDRSDASDWKEEIVQWLAPINSYILSWPLIRLRNRFLTNHLFFKKAFTLPHFNKLWGNICKGSFAYNTFLFRISTIRKNYNNTFLADLTCLALLFGDEFIDGICNEIGKEKIRQLLKENGNTFYLSVNNESAFPELEYSFDLYSLIPERVWELKNEKYRISYKGFYELLKTLLELINNRLKKLDRSIATTSAVKIKEACDLCFDTFIHDVKDTPVQLHYHEMIPPIYWHEKKNRSIQLKLLELRAILLNKQIGSFEKDFRGWLDIISTMQVYDDMQDCRSDDQFQDNLLLAFASANFPQEMEWFHENKRKILDDEQWRIQVSMNMPCASYLCIKFTKDKMTGGMNWTQKKICNYLWRNNWFNSTTNTGKRNKKETSNRLYEIIEKAFPVYELTGSEAEWKSYAFEIAFHDRELKKYILLKTNWLKRYFLHCNFIQMNSIEKTELIKKVSSS